MLRALEAMHAQAGQGACEGYACASHVQGLLALQTPPHA